jgi:hypothetical protein
MLMPGNDKNKVARADRIRKVKAGLQKYFANSNLSAPLPHEGVSVKFPPHSSAGDERVTPMAVPRQKSSLRLPPLSTPDSPRRGQFQEK